MGCSNPPACPDAACTSCDAGEEADADLPFRPDLSGCEPSGPPSISREMYSAILERLTTQVPVNEGDWGEDFGDATAFAPPALLAAGLSLCEMRYMELAGETLRHTHFLIEHFMEVIEGGEPEEVIIGILGPIESCSIIPYEGWAADANDGLGWLNDLLELFGDYLYAPDLDTSPYGPTAVTAIVAAENLRYVLVIDPSDMEKTTRAFEMAAAIDRYAWDPENEYYLASPGSPDLDLYPNVAMMIVWTLASAATGDYAYLSRAERLFGAIAPLKLEEIGAYHSIYSSSVPDYVSLSSQNYLMLALYLLYLETENRMYVEEALEILGFIETHLYYNGMAWHHWENSSRANWYCSGCNFQLLYTISLLDEVD